MHSTQTQSVRVKEKNIFYLLDTIVAALQEARINVYFVLISNSSPYVFSYRSIFSQVNTVGCFSNVLIETLFTNKLKTVFCKIAHPKTKSPRQCCFFGKSFADLPENLTFYSNIYTLASLNYTLSVSEYVTTNVTAKPFTFLRKTNNDCTVVSHTCSCNTLTVTRK